MKNEIGMPIYLPSKKKNSDSVNVNIVSREETSARSSKQMIPSIKIGSLYACDSVVPHGFTAYEVWNDSGKWSRRWIPDDTGKHVSIKTINCVIPLLVVTIVSNNMLDDDLCGAFSRSVRTCLQDQLICLYEETFVILPMEFFKNSIFSYAQTFYKELK